MPKSYNVGQRQKKYGQNHQITENRYAWIQVEGGKYIILVGNDEGHGSDVVIYHPRPGSQRDVTINLTNLTMPELEALRDLLDTAITWAEPVVERRDKEAQDAWDAGDDSHSRNYRPLPTVVYRKRPQPQHGEGVHERSVDLHDSLRQSGDDDRVRGAGAELAEPDSGSGESEDHSS